MECRIYLKILLAVLAIIAITAWGPVLRAQEIHLEDDLILYLPMNGNALDESGENVPTKVEGPVLTTDRYGNPDKAYLFNGIDDNINLNNDQALITSKQFTICMWARIDGRSHAEPTHNNSLFEQRDDNPGAAVAIHFVAERYDNMHLGLRSSAGIESTSVETAYPGDEVWYHFVTVLDEEKNMCLFINGELKNIVKFINDGNFHTGITRVNIGSHHPESVITGAFNGAIDEGYIYNRALNLCEIETLYSGQLLEER